MNFSNRPHVRAWISCQRAELLHAWLVLAGQLGRLAGAVCAAESLIGETITGLDAASAPPRVLLDPGCSPETDFVVLGLLGCLMP